MAPKGLEVLQNTEYPGRLIIVGRDLSGEHNVVVYAVTGRSPSSQARILVCDGRGTVKTKMAGPARRKAGRERLLIYSCIRRFHRALVVGNGAQTDLIVETLRGLRDRGAHLTPAEILAKALAQPHPVGPEDIDLTSYEPDGPAFTPRISGCVTDGAALSIVTRDDDGSVRKRFFEVPLMPGRGRLISTYSGDNVDPLPSFQGDPIEVRLDGQTAEELAGAVYRSLAPSGLKRDLRVGVAVVFSHIKTWHLDTFIINRHSGRELRCGEQT